jgi:glycosyltransferase involved in cell wall biosynthesis
VIRPRVSVVLPVYRQADHIAGVVSAYCAWLGQLKAPVELLLVSNGPDDGSWGICQKLAKRHRGVRALRSERGGWGLAVRLGLAQAKAPLLCYANSARTSPAELCAVLLRALQDGGSVVKARRAERGQRLRRLGSWLYNLECRLLLGTRSADVNGTPKAFPAALLPKLGLRQDGDLIDAEFCAACARLGLGLVELPFFAQARHGGASTTKLGSAWRMYLGVLGLARQGRRP